jgi:hypothetical protein
MFIRCILAIVICAFHADSASTAVVRVRPKLAAVFNSDFTPVDPSLIVVGDPYAPVLAPRDENYVVQIDFLMTIEDLHEEQDGFLSAGFNILHGNSLTRNSMRPNWVRDQTVVDSNGDLPGGEVPKWDLNGDEGANPFDLQSIIISADFRRFGGVGVDPRRTLGIAPYNNPSSNPHDDGEFAGSLFLDLLGANPNGAISIAPISAAIYGPGFPEGSTARVTFGVDELQIGVPEPTSFALLALGVGLLAVARYRAKPPRDL